MNLPAVAQEQGGHRNYLLQLQEALLRDYAELLKTARPRGKREAPGPADPPGTIRASRLRNMRRRPDVARRELPVLRFSDPPLRDYRPPRRRRQSDLARVFTLMLILHVIIIGGIVIGEAVDFSLLWKAVGIGVMIWVIFRVMAVLSRRISAGRRTTTRVTGRNCDRDICL